jgi:hypothetical protein
MILNGMAEWADKLESAALDQNVTDTEFLNLQKLVFQHALKTLKEGPEDQKIEANYLIGFIGLTDGDRYKIPYQNVLSHLQRAYSGGHAGAGIQLYRSHAGAYPFIPPQARSLTRGLLILENLSKSGCAHAAYELVLHYLALIEDYDEEDCPESHIDMAYKHAQAAFNLKYSGGYLMMGTFSYHGLYGLVPQHHASAFQYFLAGLEASNLTYLEHDIISQLHHWIGHCQMSGEGTGMNRFEGLKHINIAASMNNDEAMQWLEENEEFIGQITADDADDQNIYYDLDPVPAASLESQNMSAEADSVQDPPPKDFNPFESFSKEKKKAPVRPIFKKDSTTH